MRLQLILFSILFSALGGIAQESYYVIQDVEIVGNNRTNERIITRELAAKPGDTIGISELEPLLERSQRNIFNTLLFVTVDVKPVFLDNGKIDIYILVSERWYFFPTPIFELIDRNFNHWWVNENADLGRTIYGLRLTQRNLTGNNDNLSFTLQFGFTNRYSFRYSIPYIDKDQKYGVSFDFRYLTNNRFIYDTEAHIQQNFVTEEIIREEIRSEMAFTLRPDLYHFHKVSLGFYAIDIADTVAALNPNYLLNGRSRLNYFQIDYDYRFDRRDNIAYPLEGSLLQVNFKQMGLGLLDDLAVSIVRPSYAHYFALSDKFYAVAGIEGQFSSTDLIPYFEFAAQGFANSLVRGHELYVIEGQYMGLVKSELKYELIKAAPNLGDWIPFPQFRKFPFAIYLKAFGDAGYVVNNRNYPENQFLSNAPVYGAGLGLDLVTFYDGVFRFEGAYNTLGDFRFGINVRVAID